IANLASANILRLMIDLHTIGLERFQASAGEAAAMLRALSNEKRLMILCQLVDGEMSVGEIQSRVGLSQSALSQHLALLREDGVVTTRRESQTIYYCVTDQAALRIIETLAELFCPPEMRKQP
ncbi:ArsR/SmtB family transcription factor, partial [Sphingorhabdus sp.]|uniref:ArsR/SmtB family transcription factor n=1 Tax=Sphingorhabdus sp. TaxID=1902408 RepID=UPI003919D276